MNIKSIASAVVLTAAIAFSGPSFAQTMFNGTELSADDLPAVTERCEQLANAAATQSATDTSSTADSGAADATIESQPEVNEVEAATSTIDLDIITLEMCTEAGLPAPAM